MSWVAVHADELASGDVVLWGSARTIESVAGNEKRIVVTLDEGGDRIVLGPGSPIWRKEEPCA